MLFNSIGENQALIMRIIVQTNFMWFQWRKKFTDLIGRLVLSGAETKMYRGVGEKFDEFVVPIHQ